MRSGTSAVHIFFIWSNQFYIWDLLISDFGFQINVGSFGVTDVTKYLKLSKITNFLRQGSDAAQKIVVFHNFR